MEGVSLEAGLCAARNDTAKIDAAYRIGKEMRLSVPTKQLFPDSAFPEDFSLMATVRPKKGTRSSLLSLYDARGVQQLGLEVGPSPVLLYADHQGLPPPELYPTFSTVDLADGNWHRIAYSVQGKATTLYLDCEEVQTLELARGDDPVISTEGIAMFGARLQHDEVFEVSCMDEVDSLLILEEGSYHRQCQLTCDPGRAESPRDGDRHVRLTTP
uniref:Thrombospondin-like N-terminal domain-containing protein n=1 Tax=Paramormyrops kingsleyae TaxID=1676925 RepID=A0A3B3T2K4_9TELE